jgi:hypothetical protein
LVYQAVMPRLAFPVIYVEFPSFRALPRPIRALAYDHQADTNRRFISVTVGMLVWIKEAWRACSLLRQSLREVPLTSGTAQRRRDWNRSQPQ